jgi:hydrogenase expression/formation protein HypC
MCLGIPMQIIGINGFSARAAAKGVERDISLFMLQDDLPTVGDFVIVHVGYAIQKISEEDARQSWELFDQILAEGDA